MTTLYHGGTEIITKPNCLFGRNDLDFGTGFYLTDIKDQAIRWANRVALKRNQQAVLNVYQFDKEQYIKLSNNLIFYSYNRDWLYFVCESRRGHKPWAGLDYIEGGVANDRVIDTINLYISNLIDEDKALERLSLYEPNMQICLLNQKLCDKYLKFEYAEQL